MFVGVCWKFVAVCWKKVPRMFSYALISSVGAKTRRSSAAEACHAPSKCVLDAICRPRGYYPAAHVVAAEGTNQGDETKNKICEKIPTTPKTTFLVFGSQRVGNLQHPQIRIAGDKIKFAFG